MRYAVSLFCGAGFGDLGVHHGAGIPVLLACELRPERARIAAQLLPGCHVVCGELQAAMGELLAHGQQLRARHAGAPPFLLSLTPPCQSFSTLNHGTRQSEQRVLALDSVELIRALQPEFVVLENVRAMRMRSKAAPSVLDRFVQLLREASYSVATKVVRLEEHGVPQTRTRLVLVARRGEHAAAALEALLPEAEARSPTVREAIAELPPLCASSAATALSGTDRLHAVPVWSAHFVFMMRHTPEGRSAHHNGACAACAAEPQPAGAVRCARCDARLPVPTSACWRCARCGADWNVRFARCGACKAEREDEGADAAPHERRTRSFRNTYARLQWDAPSVTLNTYTGTLGAGTHAHPEQTRVLSVREVLRLSTVLGFADFRPPWERTVETVLGTPEHSLNCIRVCAGECVPPRFTARLATRLLRASHGV